ncbi:GNAT family N-acetyltransferase [uncultured Roseobacter sp.]|uniref:GNAT family N-acetyltransferase n=1 Tax=uncultured Roseobacter sp. TaxID=114847 RepID=UPI0026308686|nr:GNAT family N-acetyltransferase [uncultured Roseobacter sp.]
MSKSIHTDRLELRPFRDADADAVTALIGNPEVARWLTRVPHPYTAEDARQFFARDTEEAQVYAITLSDMAIGGCSIEDELGYWLGMPYWGQGYATEATHALLVRHFEAGVPDLKSGYVLGNFGSKRVLEKLGFVDTRVEKVHSVPLKQSVQVQKMVLSAQYWEARS